MTSLILAAALSFQPDLEIKFKEEINVLDIKFDTKKQIALIDLAESDSGRVYWIKNAKIIKIIKDAGYEVTSIKRLWNKKPNRYNQP
jgi:hypothetical protein